MWRLHGAAAQIGYLSVCTVVHGESPGESGVHSAGQLGLAFTPHLHGARGEITSVPLIITPDISPI